MAVVLLLGAGSTVAEVAGRSPKKRPPLDKGFFQIASATHRALVDSLSDYINENYGFDITKAPNDSLEAVMAHIYTDLFDPQQSAAVSDAFIDLLLLFNARLAYTTNDIHATPRQLLSRMIESYLQKDLKPQDLTIITFNQDWQVEKTLHRLATSVRGRGYGRLFDFPGCYELGGAHLTHSPRALPLFPLTSGPNNGITVLKLHGSLNWFSTHRNRRPKPQHLFKTDRQIFVTRRQSIPTDITYGGLGRRQNTMPVVVPPVSHKSGILHERIRTLWRLAEDRIEDADELVIYGYSCPPLDFESANMLERSFDPTNTLLRVVDPNPAALLRYVGLLQPRMCSYYPSCSDFLRYGRK